jgi:hypothetical protein
MNTSAIEIGIPTIEDLQVSTDTLTVELSGGRTLSVPLGWYPRLLHGTDAERRNWRKIGRGLGVHWEDLDDDLSVEGLLAGRSSGENPESLKQWLERRKAG